MSQADGALLETREKHPDVDGSGHVSISSWVSALQSQIQTQPSLSNPLLAIPDSVLDKSISHMLPTMQEVIPQDSCSTPDALILQKSTWRFFISTYFRTFDNEYPFIDQSLFCSPIWGWALCVAAAAVGAKYVRIPELSALSDCLCSSLHAMLSQDVSSYVTIFYRF